MKKTLSVFFAFLLIITTVFWLVSCNNSDGVDSGSDGSNTNGDPSKTEESSGETDTDAPKEKIVFASEGKSEYKITYPAQAGNDVITGATVIKNVFRSKANVQLDTGTDMYNSANKDYKFPEFEILVGLTNRPESSECAEGLAYDDYIIAVKNKKLIILGGSDSATRQAANRFKDLVTSDVISFVEGVVERYEHKYDVSSITISGKPLSDFKLIYQPRETSKYSAIADTLILRLQTICGITLAKSDSVSASADACEIVFGNCSASGYDKMPALAADEYCVFTSGNKLFIDAGSKTALNEAVEKFIEAYLPLTAKGDIKIDISAVKTEKIAIRKIELEKGASFRAMTLNVLGDNLAGRADIIIEKILEYYPEVVGLQECNSSGQKTIVDALSDFYGSAVGYIDGTTTKAYTPILYRKDKLKLIESGAVFFEKRYTGTNTKTMSWAVFEEIETGKKFAVLNAHYALIAASYNLGSMTNAVEGAQWREDNSRQMLEKAAELKNKYNGTLPVMLMGDLNSNRNSKSIQMLEDVYNDSMNVATVSKTTGMASYHSKPGQVPKAGMPIDFIFVDSALINVYRHLIPTDSATANISDHAPVITDISFK